MEQVTHGFCTRDEWQKLFADYNLVISELNDSSYELILSDLPADEWIARYMENSARVREAYKKNEAMLNRHIRWFTRAPSRWTREIADPLLSMLFRYVTRVQDLGTVYEIANSLLEYYGPKADSRLLMKCYMIRAFSRGFLDNFHLAEEVHADCMRARKIYESRFYELTPEEQSMGLSIYDLDSDRASNLLKLGQATPQMLDEMIACHRASSWAKEEVLAADRGYEFNASMPDFEYYLSFAALCLKPGGCTPAQADAIYDAAKRQYATCKFDPEYSEAFHVRCGIIYLMARRLKGLCSDREVIENIKKLMTDFAPLVSEGSTYSQHGIEAAETIQIATENVTCGGKTEPELYSQVQEFFVQYLCTRPYTTFVDYICASCNYCYILTALPHIADPYRLLVSLVRLTMFRQIQTAMHSIMVANLALEILDSLTEHKPWLLAGQLGLSDAADVQRHKEPLRRYLCCGALLHDIGKLLCSSVINAQSHRLNGLEFKVLRFHPGTGGEMLDKLPGLSTFADLARGHQKSFDGKFGYPEDFDNTASPQKILIDIITVCDSLDAATDHLGRNYAAVKDFPTVLGELRDERNTRYSGEIVDLLDSDEKLQKRLRYLLEDGRRNVYYDIHKMILSQSNIRGSEINTHSQMIDLALPQPEKSPSGKKH